MNRFVINPDGTVTDTTTGLIWQQATAGPMEWEDAMNYCKCLTLGGYNDWRIPTIEELFNLVDRSRYNPAIDTDAFPDTVSSDYWSSTTYAYGTDGAWCVYFSYGGGGYDGKSSSLCVRTVRSGQSGLLDDLVIAERLNEIARELTSFAVKLRGGKP